MRVSFVFAVKEIEVSHWTVLELLIILCLCETERKIQSFRVGHFSGLHGKEGKRNKCIYMSLLLCHEVVLFHVDDKYLGYILCIVFCDIVC